MSEDSLERAASWKREGRKVAIATVIETWGSSPRPPGSQLVVRDDSLFLGSVSGGCIEGRVVGEALEVMEDEQPRTLTFGVADEEAWEVGLACGGTVRVRVEAVVDLAFLEQLNAARAAKRAVVVITDLDSGEQRLVDGQAELPPAQRQAVERALSSDRSQVREGQFLRPYSAPLRLLVVGGVHIAQVLVPMATMVGYEVVVIDPRTAFASPERFADVELSNAWPDEAMAELGLDSRTAVVTLTHDPKIDDPALVAALGSDAFYVGALGSRRTHAARIERLSEQGLSEDQVARIHGPVGLPLGGRSPAEIAVSILAQMTQVLRGGAK